MQMCAFINKNFIKTFVFNFPGKTTGVVRVVQRESEERVLLKGMRGKVKDLAFAHCTDSVIYLVLFLG
jgi:hypothetical protein